MSDGPLRVAVCGVGWFGGVHARCWATMPGVELVGLADPVFAAGRGSGGRAQDDFHQDVGGGGEDLLAGVPRFASVEELLEAARPDLVDVTTTEDAHVPVAVACLEHGAHVTIEKPIALDVAGVRRLAEVSEATGRLVLPAHVLRFDARYIAVHERARQATGRMLLVSTQRHFQRQAHAVYGRVHPALNALVHDIDIAMWLVGGVPARVRGYERAGDDGSPRVLSAVFEWADGATALLENAWHLINGLSAGYEFRCTVMHEEFSAIVAPAADVGLFDGGGVATFPDVHLWPSLPAGVGGALRAELMHFAGCARRGKPSPVVGLADAERTVRVATALVESAASEGWVELGD